MSEVIEGMCRNEQHKVRSHLYMAVKEVMPIEEVSSYRTDAVVNGKVEVTNLYPMCGYGWNRSNGQSYSIFRGNKSARGTCKLCMRNLEAGKNPVIEGFPHKTKWI